MLALKDVSGNIDSFLRSKEVRAVRGLCSQLGVEWNCFSNLCFQARIYRIILKLSLHGQELFFHEEEHTAVTFLRSEIHSNDEVENNRAFEVHRPGFKSCSCDVLAV